MEHLMNWNFTTIPGTSRGECVRCLRNFIYFVDSGILEKEIDGALGLAGEMPNGEVVKTRRIKKIEKTRFFRGPINGLMVMAWELKKVREVYRVTTDDDREYYIRLCEAKAEMISVLNQVFEMTDRDYKQNSDDDLTKGLRIISIDGFVSQL